MNLASKKHPGVVRILCEWSAWTRSNSGIHLGFLYKSVYYDSPEMIKGSEITYDPDLAFLTDRILASMTLIPGKLSQQIAIVHKYYYGDPVETICRKINKNVLPKHRIKPKTVSDSVLPRAHDYLNQRFRTYEDFKHKFIDTEESKSA